MPSQTAHSDELSRIREELDAQNRDWQRCCEQLAVSGDVLFQIPERGSRRAPEATKGDSTQTTFEDLQRFFEAADARVRAQNETIELFVQHLTGPASNTLFRIDPEALPQAHAGRPLRLSKPNALFIRG